MFLQCDFYTGDHQRVNLDSTGIADLRLLLHTYQRWSVPSYVAQAWADWVHETLNQSSNDVNVEETLSIEVFLGWSTFRISFVVLLPILLSLGIGIWFNRMDWSDLLTIQTAWGLASYAVTTGSCKFSIQLSTSLN